MLNSFSYSEVGDWLTIVALRLAPEEHADDSYEIPRSRRRRCPQKQDDDDGLDVV